jgi:nucleoside 2-deoxyribosyltransferase
MKIFCSYAYRDEDPHMVTKRMQLVVDTLNAHGHEAYCNRFDAVVDELGSKDDVKGIMQEVLNHIEKSDALVVIIISPRRSIGQIMEIGIALSQKKPVYLFEHTSAAGSSYLPRLVDTYHQWNTEDTLIQALASI